jgi:O-antigen/teichoic acid export membrane protein
MSILLAVLAVQMSLITTPYAVQHHSAGEASRRYGGNAVIMQLGLMVLVLAAFTVAQGLTSQSHRALAYAMFLAAPVLLLREFLRRMAFAQLDLVQALAIDFPVAVIQLLMLGVFIGLGKLSCATAFAALATAACFGSLIGFVRLRRQVDYDYAELPADVRRHWKFGRWIAGGQILGVVNGQGTYWIVAFLRGTPHTGYYAAALSIVALSNPFMLAVGNMLTPRAAKTLADDGDVALRALIVRAAIAVAAIMGIFAIALIVTGDWLMRLLFGPEFAGHGAVVSLLALSFLVASVGMVVNDGLRARGLVNIEFGAMVIDTVVTVGLGWIALIHFGLPGLAAMSLLGSLSATGLQVLVFVRGSRA